MHQIIFFNRKTSQGRMLVGWSLTNECTSGASGLSVGLRRSESRCTGANSCKCSTGIESIVAGHCGATLGKTQLVTGRWAVGMTGHKVASEFLIMGETEWSTFEAREKQSKTQYFAQHRWPRTVLSMTAAENIYNEAIQRLQYLKIRFGCSEIPIEFKETNEVKLELFNRNVKKRIREKQEETWKEAINSKPSLKFYREHKIRGVTPYGLYENSRGSALSFLVRAGMLPIRRHRPRHHGSIPSA